jgi:hypothetical protein
MEKHFEKIVLWFNKVVLKTPNVGLHFGQLVGAVLWGSIFLIFFFPSCQNTDGICILIYPLAYSYIFVLIAPLMGWMIWQDLVLRGFGFPQTPYLKKYINHAEWIIPQSKLIIIAVGSNLHNILIILFHIFSSFFVLFIVAFWNKQYGACCSIEHALAMSTYVLAIALVFALLFFLSGLRVRALKGELEAWADDSPSVAFYKNSLRFYGKSRHFVSLPRICKFNHEGYCELNFTPQKNYKGLQIPRKGTPYYLIEVEIEDQGTNYLCDIRIDARVFDSVKSEFEQSLNLSNDF